MSEFKVGDVVRVMENMVEVIRSEFNDGFDFEKEYIINDIRSGGRYMVDDDGTFFYGSEIELVEKKKGQMELPFKGMM